MNILFIGDIFGKTGRKMIETYLPKIVEKYSVECVIANGENTSHGKGLLQKHYDELLSHGISLITMGNHTYSKKEIFEYIDEADKLIVPLNKPKAMPGVGSRVIEIKGKKIRVTNLLGLTFMDGKPQNPFEAIDPVLEEDDSDIHIIDFHGEATSEKIAFGYYVDGRVSAVLGTHTHVPTGCEKEGIIERSIKGIMTPFRVAEDEGQLCATLLHFDGNKCKNIERIRIDPQVKFK